MNAVFPTPDAADSQRLLSPEELEAALRDIGARRYHNLHPFHRLLHDGKLSKDQVRAWALNRYYYQAMIPVKDAAVLARMTDASLRRIWRQRIVDHDGDSRGRWRHRALAQARRGRGFRPRLRALDPRHPLGDKIFGRGLRPFRLREELAGSDRLVAHRDVLADDHLRARRRDAEELRLHHQGHAGLFRQAPRRRRRGMPISPWTTSSSTRPRPNFSGRRWRR